MLLLTTPALAQEAAAPRSIRLQEAIGLAVRQNRTLAAASADIEVAIANEFGARGNEDLLLGAAADVTARRSQPLETAQFQQLEFTNLHTELSASKPLFFGGRIGLLASHDYTRTKTRIRVMGQDLGETVTEEFTPTVQVTYFQPLLRGFGETAMRAQRLRTRSQTEIARLERANSVANVIRDVIVAYWELAYAAQEVDIRRSSLDLAREQLRITQARLDVGVGSPTDVAAVRQGIATRESELLIAELAVSERALDLRQLVGMDITPTEIDLVAGDRLEFTPQQVDLGQAMNAAFANNAQIATLQARGEAATIEIEIANNALRPRLDLNASFGPSGNAESFGAAVERMAEFKDFQIFGGLTFEYPVGNHTARGSYRAAVAQRERVRVNEDDMRRIIAVSVAKSVNQLRSTEKRMQADREAVELAQINLDAEKARFEVGRTTNFEVLRRQDELAQSRLRLSRAAADYMLAVAGLQTLTGELLPAYGITVTPSGGSPPPQQTTPGQPQPATPGTAPGSTPTPGPGSTPAPGPGSTPGTGTPTPPVPTPAPGR